MATTLTDAARASHPLDPEFVLAGRPLRPDCSLEQTSRFGEDIWRLGPAINSESSLLKILNFAHIPTRFRTTVKELFYVMLAGKLPPGEPAPRDRHGPRPFHRDHPVSALAGHLAHGRYRPTGATARRTHRRRSPGIPQGSAENTTLAGHAGKDPSIDPGALALPNRDA